MNEELLYTTSEEQIDVEVPEIIESEVDIETVEEVVAQEETEEIIEVEPIEEMEIEVDEAIGWVGGDSERHYSLLGRDERDQHPITAITGLRDELDEIERLKTVCADKPNIATYYEWSDGAHDDYGYFVSLVPSTSTVKLCEGADILGVTVESAGFIGRDNQSVPRDNKYCLVVTSGLVSVRCESDVNVGDCVMSNERGVAEKTYNDYGFEVMALKDIEGIIYAVIDLKVQMRKVRALASVVGALDERVDKSEKDIVAAINVAQQAYNKASDTDRIAEEVLDKVGGIVVRVDANIETTNRIEQNAAETNRIAVEARTIADLAVTSAETIRIEAEKTANETLANVNELVKDLEPITNWTYIDPITGEQSTGAEYLTTYIGDNLATKAEVHTVETLAEDNKTLIEKNAENFQTMISSVDKYSVGEYSQSYGLSRAQAKAILKIGMVYIPTKHIETDSHIEFFVGEEEEQEFTPGSYYEWHINDQGQHDWIEYGNSVAFGMNEPTHTNQLRYWYIDSDQALEGYESYALYAWVDEKWTKVNVLAGNANNRITSMIRQTANEINAEVVNARGSAATLGGRIDEESAQVALLTEWKGFVGNSMSAIELTADDIGSSIAQIVQGVGADGQVTAASIVTAINNQTGDSVIQLNADLINLNGAITANGNVKIGTDGKITAVNADISGEIKATSGYIGSGTEGFEINSKYISNGKASYSDNKSGVYLGTDGIGLGSGAFYVTKNGYMYASSGEFEGDISGGTININDKFKVDQLGNVTLAGNITWGDNYPEATVTDGDIAEILTNGEQCGIFYTDEGKLAINADYIKAGKINAGNIDLNGAMTADDNLIIGSDGKITAKDATIQGNIDASSLIVGPFAGTNSSRNWCWEIDNTGIHAYRGGRLATEIDFPSSSGEYLYLSGEGVKAAYRGSMYSMKWSEIYELIHSDSSGSTNTDPEPTPDPDPTPEPDPDNPEEPTCSHSSTTDREENVVAATCTAEGSYDLVTYCDDCGEETGRQDKVIDTLPHTYQWVAGQTFSCGSKQQVYKCVNGCNNVTDTRIIMNGKNCYKGVDGTTCAICGRPM